MPRKVKPISDAEIAELSGKVVAKAHKTDKAYRSKGGKPHGGKRAVTQANIETYARRLEAYQYRVMGYSYTQIGEFMDTTPTQAKKLVDAWRRERLFDERDQIREIHTDRLEMMRAGLTSAAMGGDVMAIDRMLKIDEREAKLRGLDEAEKVEIIDNTDPRKIMHAEIGAIFQRLAAQNIDPKTLKKEG